MSRSQKPPQPTEQSEQLIVDIDAECGALGFLQLGGAWQDDLGADDFSRDLHKTIFYAMDALVARGERIERSSVAIELRQRRKLAASGGLDYLANLDSETGITPESNIRPYIERLHDCRDKRRIQQHLHIVTTHLQRDDRTAAELTAAGTDFYRELQNGQNHQESPPPTTPSWPEPLHEDAFHGVAGELVRVIEPHTEADPAALLLQFLAGWGNLVGRGPYFLAEEDRHHTNENVVIVGTTSKARKGTSWGRVGNILGVIDPHWLENRLLSGLGSGEALIDAAGEEDRRTLVIEGEFARLLAVVSREGSTISASLRTAWDTGSLSIRTRQNKIKVTGAHLSMIGHITREELLRRLDSTETANGFGNRKLWCCARRSKILPHGGGDMKVSSDFLHRLQQATEHARKTGNTRVRFDDKARELWEAVYPDLSEGKPGLLGSMTSRAEAHVVRLALIYALLDRSDKIHIEHLRAALAVWRYCEASARYIWGDQLGDPEADEILRALRAAGAEGMTRWDIINHFSRHKKAEQLDRAIGVLTERGLIRSVTEDTGGRPVTWYWAL